MRLDDFYRIKDQIPDNYWPYIEYYYYKIFDANTDISLTDWNAAAEAVVSVLNHDLWKQANEPYRDGRFGADLVVNRHIAKAEAEYKKEIEAVKLMGTLAQRSAEENGNTQDGSGILTMAVTNPSAELLKIQNSRYFRNLFGGSSGEGIGIIVVAVVAVILLLLIFRRK